MSLKELKVNRVPIFTRLNSYKNVLKLKALKFDDGYLETEKREFLTR